MNFEHTCGCQTVTKIHITRNLNKTYMVQYFQKIISCTMDHTNKKTEVNDVTRYINITQNLRQTVKSIAQE